MTMKTNRSARRRIPEEAQRAAARKYISQGVRAGTIEPGECSVDDCSEDATHYEHDDYTKPAAVTWYCRKHHREAQRELLVIVED